MVSRNAERSASGQGEHTAHSTAGARQGYRSNQSAILFVPTISLPPGSLSRYHVDMSKAKASRVNVKTPKKRPPVTGDLVGVRIQPGLAKQIDTWRRGQEDSPGRPEAIRRLVAQALKAKK
jgi:hypothetical protein